LKNLSNKNIAIGTVVIFVSLITCLAFFTATFPALQCINPTAAIAAITVAVIDIAWFKKTTKVTIKEGAIDCQEH
jgi:hypothetical protein